jgi:uncharacterized membrane protein
MLEIIPNWHPLLVHFTLGLLLVAVALYVIVVMAGSHRWHTQWLHAANWNLWIGGAFTILTVLAGWYAYNTVAHDTPSHAAMTTHRNWALVTTAVILLLAVWSVLRYRDGKLPNVPFLAVALVSAGLLLTTGWHGAEAVYRYGLGVQSLPQAEGAGHAHEHAGGEGHTHAEAGSQPDKEKGEAGPAENNDAEAAAGDGRGQADHPETEGRVHTHADGTVERH